VPPAIKFCGLTRPEDAAFAAELGARYVGAVFAESPRRVTADGARAVYAAAAGGKQVPQGVAVFGPSSAGEVAALADAAGAAVVQLHGDPDMDLVRAVSELFAGELWAVVRAGGSMELPALLVESVDGIVLDTASAALLGGTGRSFNWKQAAKVLDAGRRPRKLVLAGGLRPSNVGDAIQLLRPDVVDVSSGVESSTGIKDHALMRAFAEAVERSDDR
jgi:phosphoribosylanthranilate isomerase